jgi:hypothetical protein
MEDRHLTLPGPVGIGRATKGGRFDPQATKSPEPRSGEVVKNVLLRNH